jgi:regulator of protease activity HflC (stomatin/prohibitin superfamily)
MRIFFTLGLLALLAVIPFTSLAILAECNPETGECAPVSQTPTPEPRNLIDNDPLENMNVGKAITYVILAIVALVSLFGSVFIVSQQTSVVIERLGKFQRVASAGLNFKVPLIDRKAGALDLRVQQMNLQTETKTKDNVFVVVSTSLQFTVLPDKVQDAFYRLNNSDKQIAAFVYDVIRSKVPHMNLDEAFAKKEDIATAVKTELAATMDDFGYNILTALVTDVEPDAKVKKSMNEINAAKRLREAAQEEGEGKKILAIKQAEAEAESKRLQGEGIANQRKAIVDGLKASVQEFQEATGTNAQEVMGLILMVQYFNTLKEIGEKSQTNTIMLPHSPGGMNQVADQIRDAMIAANKT